MKETKLRILYHHRTQAEDAQGIHIYEIVNAFRHLGHFVEMVSLVDWDEKGEKKIRGKRWKIIAEVVPNFIYELMEILYNILGYWSIKKQIEFEKPDFIYERYTLNTFCGIWAARKYGIPIILEVNAPLYHEQKKYGKLTFQKFAAFSERWICSNSTKTIVVTYSMKKILIQEGIPENNIIVMPNGINPEIFHKGIKGFDIRKQYQISDNKTIFGFIGWFRPWHGLEMILEICYEEKLFDKGVFLMFVGDGPAYSNLYAYAEKNKILNYIAFTGPISRNEVPKYIAAFDIALQPKATSYASPMKIFEYMAMGKGVIAPRQENISEILDDGEDSILFIPDNRDSLKNALEKILNDKEIIRRLGQNAFEKIYSREYLWKRNAEKVIKLIV